MVTSLLSALAAFSLMAFATSTIAQSLSLPQLKEKAQIIRDVDGIAHIYARSEHDMFLLQGWIHARDRFFQMDLSRRQASGTVAEVLGLAALSSDVQMRTIGLRRAAERSLEAMQASAAAGDSVSAQTIAALQAYAKGVNAYLARALPHSLPPEYPTLGLTTVDPWTPLDSLAIGKLIAFLLSFDLGDIDNSVTLQTYQAVLGKEAGLALFAEDLFRSQPFNPAATVPDSGGDGPPRRRSGFGEWQSIPEIDADAANMARRFKEKIQNVPLLQRALKRELTEGGSNNWGVSAQHSATGNPLIANDPHLWLEHPTTFYPIHLRSPGYDAAGNGFAGAPFIITGQNNRIVWGPTVNPMDVTDVFLDTVVPDKESPSGLSIVLPGNVLGPIVPVAESYGFNDGGTVNPVPKKVLESLGISPITLTVPHRYNGVIVQFDGDVENGGAALTLQYTGFGPTRELEAFYIFDKSRDLSDFRRGLERFDFGSQNWAYADRRGNIAYFTSGEMPIRTDLETLGGPALGIPPYFIRIGADPRHQWMPKVNEYPNQTTPFEILSPEEMPQVVNPVNGFFVNANNDPLGFTNDNNPLNQLRESGGILYLSPRYAAGLRASRITQLLNAAMTTGERKVSVAEMAAIQADVALPDAEFFAPRLIGAYQAAQATDADPALAAVAHDPRLADAIARIEEWTYLDYQSKTGIPEGYDAADPADNPGASLSAEEIAASVATTLYSVWRSSFIALTIDATLDALALDMPRPGASQTLTALKTLIERNGVSASGVDFFRGGAADQATDVQVVMLAALSDALNRLGSDEFAQAFAGSTDLNDYRWGKLHRIEFASPLGQPFSVPDAFGFFPAPLSGLRGVPTDGGFGSVDVAPHGVNAKGVDGFMFFAGPTNRWVADVGRVGPRSQSVWPGGVSAVPGDPHYVFPMLPRWLANDAEPIRFRFGEIYTGAATMVVFRPQ